MTQQIPEWLEELLNEWLFVTVGMSHKHTDVKVGFYKCYELLSKPEFAAKIECVKALIKSNKFYADRDNWTIATAQSCSTMVGPDDHDVLGEPFGKQFTAGRIAREASSPSNKRMKYDR